MSASSTNGARPGAVDTCVSDVPAFAVTTRRSSRPPAPLR
jgi:hypothetical protein